jgi:hypothetical protein
MDVAEVWSDHSSDMDFNFFEKLNSGYEGWVFQKASETTLGGQDFYRIGKFGINYEQGRKF